MVLPEPASHIQNAFLAFFPALKAIAFNAGHMLLFKSFNPRIFSKINFVLVCCFGFKWRARKDLNLRPLDS
jgi:hypothetical protein